MASRWSAAAPQPAIVAQLLTAHVSDHSTHMISGVCPKRSVHKRERKRTVGERGKVYDVQGAASGMRSKVVLFLEVRDNFSEGLRFYMSLQEAISHLAQQVGDYSMTRQIQR